MLVTAEHLGAITATPEASPKYYLLLWFKHVPKRFCIAGNFKTLRFVAEIWRPKSSFLLPFIPFYNFFFDKGQAFVQTIFPHVQCFWIWKFVAGITFPSFPDNYLIRSRRRMALILKSSKFNSKKHLSNFAVQNPPICFLLHALGM